MRVGITGSTGLIGTAIARHLREGGHEAVGIVRRPPSGDEIAWDPDAGTIDRDGLQRLDAIVHLAGAGIGDHRWTEEYKRTLVDSRVRGTTVLSEALAELDGAGPRVLVSGSAIGFYGNRGDEELDETSPAGEGFLADICQVWEDATGPAESAGVRVAHIRTGIVLSRHGGALKKMLPLFKVGAGGRFGNGRQWMSWISIQDEVGAIEHLLSSPIRGAVNLTAPGAVRNADFARTRVRAAALLFDGQRVTPQMLLADGYRFEHPDLPAALRAVLAR
jgi:uncharacterized protein